MIYFDHDTSAATDPKIMMLRLKCGGAAVDAYWYLVEQMHKDMREVCVRNADAMQVHSQLLCTDSATFEKWVDSMISCGLIEVDEDTGLAMSPRASANIFGYLEQSEKRRSAANSRWKNANAKQVQCKRNAANGDMQCQEKKRKGSNATKALLPTDSVGAEAGEPAPPSSPPCPMCETKMWRNKQIGMWRCDNCGIDVPDDKAVT